MKSRHLLILAGLVVALGAFIAFFERHQPTTDQAAARADLVFPGLEESDAAGLTIENASGRFTLEKAGEQWRLTTPIHADADAQAVEAVLRALTGLERQRVLAPDEVDAGEYGLDQPSSVVTVISDDGSTSTLTLGNPTPLGSQRAVTVADSTDIILTADTVFSAVDKGLDGWRSRSVADLVLDDLATIDVRQPSGRVEAVRLGTRWTLRSPVEDLADADHLQAVISGLNSLRVEAFVDADDPSMGLDQSNLSIRTVPKDGSPGLTLEFGATRTVGARAEIACRRNRSDVFWVGEEPLSALRKAAVLWRDPKVVDFNAWNVIGIDFTVGETRAQLHKADGIWTDAEGVEMAGDAIDERLWALADLNAVAFDLIPLGTAEIGSILLTLDGTADPITCTFFEPLEAGGQVLVEVSNRPTLMGVAPDAVDTILADLDELRRRPEPDDSDNTASPSEP